MIVASISLAASSCVEPGTCGGTETESVLLAFARITWTYTDHSVDPAVEYTSCWDLVTWSPC